MPAPYPTVKLLPRLEESGLRTDCAAEVGEIIRRWNSAQSTAVSIAALRRLLRGDVPILLEAGEREATLVEVVGPLLGATHDPTKIVQSLTVGAICSGAVGEYAAFLECTDPTVNARHQSRPGRWPVPGLLRPDHVRLAYARLAGYSGDDDRVGTKTRGDARSMNAAGYPSPSVRYGVPLP